MPVFDVQDPRFAAARRHARPGSGAWCVEHGRGAAGRPTPPRVRSILESLAVAYAASVRTAAELAGREVRRSSTSSAAGSQNELLCQLTADRCGLPVLAGPVEATALGNVLVQGRAPGADLADLADDA